jgi:hypothetical protein
MTNAEAKKIIIRVKTIEKLKNIFDWHTLWGDLTIVDDPMKRCFSFTDDSEELFVLSLSEIKCLPRSLQKFFAIKPKNAKDIVYSLSEWVEKNRTDRST